MRNEIANQRRAARRAELAAAIVTFVTERFIAEGVNSTVAEIAAGVDASEPAVRGIFAEGSGTLPGLEYNAEARTSYSNNYRGFEAGSHKVGTWGPTRKALAALIVAHRKGG